MPGKMARSVPRSPFGLPEVRVAVCTSRQSCRKAGKARRFTRHRRSSGESRMKPGASLTTRIEGLGSITNKIVDSTHRKVTGQGGSQWLASNESSKGRWR
jgi:hypothetical protein